jgi:hypothetical protein
MFKNSKLFLVKSLILERYIIVFEKDIIIYLMYKNTVFKVCIKQRIYIVKEEKIFFINREKSDNSLNLNLDLNITYKLDKNNVNL